MAKQTRNIIKGYFETGKKPTQGNYTDLLDSVFILSGENTGSLLLKGPANINGSITASGNISASGDITANDIFVSGLISRFGDSNTGLQFASDTVIIEGNDVNIANFNTTNITFSKDIIANSNITSTGNTTFGDASSDTHTFTGAITASNDISSSATITANQFVGDGKLITGITSSLITQTLITASVATGSLILSGTLYHPSASSDILVGLKTTGSVIPGRDGSFDLGSPTHYFKDSFVSKSHANVITTHRLSTTDITSSGDIVVGNDLYVNQYIKHTGDVNTFINFTDDRIRLNAGGINFIDLEKDSSTPYPLTINNGGNRINFRVKDRNNNLLLKTDSEAYNVKLYYADNLKLETTSSGISITGNITSSGHISGTAAGNITGFKSGSFTYLETTGDISASGTVFANSFESAGGNVGGITFADDLNLTGHLTASGNISSSGEIIAASANITNITGSNISASGEFIGASANITNITS